MIVDERSGDSIELLAEDARHGAVSIIVDSGGDAAAICLSEPQAFDLVMALLERSPPCRDSYAADRIRAFLDGQPSVKESHGCDPKRCVGADGTTWCQCTCHAWMR